MAYSDLKILFIGLGGIGQRHLRNLHSRLGGRATFLAYRVRGLRYAITPNLTLDGDADFVERYSVRVFADLDDALSESPDVAFVCNPTSRHVAACLSVARAGCDFFVEKPLSDSLEGIEELVSVCRSKELVAMVGYQLRFHPCFRLFSRLLSRHVVGALLSVHSEVGEYLPGWHKYEDYRQMYASRRELGGGVVLSQIHELDYLCNLFGMPSMVAAFGGHLSSLEIDVEDTADILMRSTFEGRILPISVHMDYIQRPPSRFCRVIGEMGTITMDLVGPKVVVERHGEQPEVHNFASFERNQLFLDEIDHLLGCVATRNPPIVTIEDGRDSLSIALAAKEAMEDGRVVSLSGRNQ